MIRGPLDDEVIFIEMPVAAQGNCTVTVTCLGISSSIAFLSGQWIIDVVTANRHYAGATNAGFGVRVTEVALLHCRHVEFTVSASCKCAVNVAAG